MKKIFKLHHMIISADASQEFDKNLLSIHDKKKILSKWVEREQIST